jgi:rhomboid family GlyGly-CTERM serine protease
MWLLEYNRAAIAGGQWWRVFTCHFVHWSADNLLWDALAFVVLLAICIHQDVRRTIATIALSSVAIPISLLLLLPQMQTYRGLSGIDSALFGLAWMMFVQHSRRYRMPLVLLGIAFLAKLLIETTTGRSIFVDSTAAQFVPVPLAHLVGFVVGALLGADVGRILFPRYDCWRNERHSRQPLYCSARTSPVRATSWFVSAWRGLALRSRGGDVLAAARHDRGMRAAPRASGDHDGPHSGAARAAHA